MDGLKPDSDRVTAEGSGGTAHLELQGLRAGYGQMEVIHGIDLSVQHNQQHVAETLEVAQQQQRQAEAVQQAIAVFRFT